LKTAILSPWILSFQFARNPAYCCQASLSWLSSQHRRSLDESWKNSAVHWTVWFCWEVTSPGQSTAGRNGVIFDFSVLL